MAITYAVGGGVCPGNNLTAGKRKSSRIKKANKFLLAALVEAAWGASHKKDSACQRKFHRWLKRLGKKKACIAICRHMLQIIWSVLKNGRPFVEPDAVVLQSLQREKQIRHHAQRLRQLGAPEETIAAMVTHLLESPPMAAEAAPGKAATVAARDSAPGTAKSADRAGQPRAKCASGRPKRPPQPGPARGVLGFRIYSKEKRLYSVFKEQPGTAPGALTPKATPPRNPPELSGRKKRRVG